jgi:anti-sigma factor RsiW
MKPKRDHPPSTEALTRLVTGELSDAESAQLLDQIAADEEQLGQLDELWSTQPLQKMLANIADIDTETSRRVQRRLEREIQRANLAGNVVRFGTRGFAAVAAGLLRPFIAPRNQYPRRKNSSSQENSPQKGSDHD